jgi:hypothetical protein
MGRRRNGVSDIRRCCHGGSVVPLWQHFRPWDEVFEAADGETAATGGRQRYGVESFVCLRLVHAAQRSVETGAAIAFC